MQRRGRRWRGCDHACTGACPRSDADAFPHADTVSHTGADSDADTVTVPNTHALSDAHSYPDPDIGACTHANADAHHQL